MDASDVPVKPLLIAAGTVVAVVALVVGAVFTLLHAWHATASGTPLHGAAAVAGMAARGPALESAPQIDGETYRAAKARELAASEAASERRRATSEAAR